MQLPQPVPRWLLVTVPSGLASCGTPSQRGSARFQVLRRLQMLSLSARNSFQCFSLLSNTVVLLGGRFSRLQVQDNCPPDAGFVGAVPPVVYIRLSCVRSVVQPSFSVGLLGVKASTQPPTPLTHECILSFCTVPSGPEASSIMLRILGIDVLQGAVLSRSRSRFWYWESRCQRLSLSQW